MKILLTFVGNHDPYADDKQKLGPVLSILTQIEFDKVYLLFNSDKYWNTLYGIQNYCREYNPELQVFFRLTESANPADYNIVYPEMYKIVTNIAKENPKADFTISLTSGTPTMHSCWILLVQGKVVDAKLIQISREIGIEKVNFTLNDFPHIKKVSDVKLEMTKLKRENSKLKKIIEINNSTKTDIIIPEEGIDFDKEVVPAYYDKALALCDGNATKAAELLKIQPPTFRKRLRVINKK